MEMSKNTKIIVLLFAALLAVCAVLLNGTVAQQSPYKAAVQELSARGYTLSEDDLFDVGSFEDTTIAEVLAGQDLTQAVEAGIAGGFPSDVNAAGDIRMLLLTMENKDIITIFLRDGKIELCFVQRLDDSAIRPLS